jgi:hypothetical protein
MTAGLLNGAAYSLLLGCFGTAVLLSMRRGSGLVSAFEMLAFGYFSILFHGPALALLQDLGKSLEVFLLAHGSVSDLDKFVGASLADAASKDKSGSAMGYVNNVLTYTAQIVRTGVWGVLASSAELLFLLARFLLEVGRDALWQILVVLFPLSAAFLPVASKLFVGMALFAVELCLWLPMLAIINIACSEVARRYMQIPADIGFYVLAVEIIAVTLTFAVPVMAHKFVTGSLSGSVIESWKQTALRSRAIFSGATALKGMLNKGTGRTR